MGLRKMGGLMAVLMVTMILAVDVTLALAQDAAAPAGGGWATKLKDLAMTLLPVIWGSVAPIVTAAVTSLTNKWTGAYVPRQLQGIISTVFAAIAAGLSQPAGGMDPGSAMAVGGFSGLVGQILAALRPGALLTDAPAPVKPATQPTT